MLPFLCGRGIKGKDPGLEQTSPPAPPRKIEVSNWLCRSQISVLLGMLAGTAILTASLRLVTPLMADAMAQNLPASWVKTSSEHVLGSFEHRVFQPSRHPQAELESLRNQFAALSAPPAGAPPYRLLFRSSTAPETLLQAFPGGEIVVTDQFLEAIPDQGERLALLCHELGHLQHQHALRNAIGHNLYWLAGAAFLGNVDGSVHALSNGIQQVRYSRAQILEADAYAQSMLHTNNIPPQVLIDAIEHWQTPANTRGAGGRREYFTERMRALQNPS